MSNIVAIIGRPNVGKSTLFNRLTEKKQAIVDETSGVTRDRHYGKAIWNGVPFSIIDTGGYAHKSGDEFEEAIRRQVLIAVEEADFVLFMVDVTSGITDYDEAVAKILRKSQKKMLLVVNKVDNNQRYLEANLFYKLGLGDPYSVSSISGSGTGDLLDELVKNLEPIPETEGEDDIPRFAIVGRPNVGKSSLVNSLLGEERNIVTPIAGTTRDTILTRYTKFGHDFFLIDTAGLRKKEKVKENLEFYSVLRAVRTIESSDVCLLILDASRGVESQDVSIFNLIRKNKKGIVVLVNKWDLVEKDTHTAKAFEQVVKERFEPFVDVPVIFTSVINKLRIHKVLETAAEVYQNRRRRIPTAKLNEVMQQAIENNHPPAVKGKYVRIKYVTQIPSVTPSFAFFCNLPQYVKDSYRRYLENQIRAAFNFTGVPIQIYMRKK